MKKTNFLYASAIMMAFAFGMTSCEQSQDNPVPPTPQEPVYEAVFTYDFAAEQALIAAGTVEKPGNLGGNQNNGQGFNAYSVKIRNDYKGYVKKDGSTLPEVCTIWRRTDRFDQDASWNTAGGVKMPNNREFAIDGLKAGYIVEITYDATSAADDAKELIWAVGEVDAEGNAINDGTGTPVATALINGAEAVPGVTPIPSGAKIELKSVTPAVKGNEGYIVIQVKKNMVISKIAVSKKAE
jgi:hypothetical protein